MLQWIELLTKQFNNSQAACEVGAALLSAWEGSCTSDLVPLSVSVPLSLPLCPCPSQWFLDQMADDNWWPMQILIKCPNQIVRQVSQKGSG